MKKLFLLLSIVLLGTLTMDAGDTPAPTKVMRYVERVSETSSTFQNQGLPPKSDRVSAYSGNIIYVFDEELPDSIMTALNAAKKLWEAKIENKVPIYIYVGFESLGDDISMISEISCVEGGRLDGCPCALASQLNGKRYGDDDSLDGLLIFNSDIPWNCSFAKESMSEYNVPTMTLRGIAKCLGFGSTIIEEGGSFVYYFYAPSYFDRLLYNNNIKLESLEQGSLEMAQFVQSNNVSVWTEFNNYKMYAPPVYEAFASLCYFDDDDSLMSHNIGSGNIDLTIDKKTEDILKTIGWDLTSDNYEIKCDDISEDGIGSAYSVHKFYLDTKNGVQQDYKWRFFIKDKSGEFVSLIEDTAEYLWIPEMGNNSGDYYINVNGDLEGRVECDFIMNGRLYTSIFNVSLELKPQIISIDNVKVIPSTTYGFYTTFDVSYSGADHLYANVEEEFDTTMRNYRVDEPYIAHVKTGNISTLFYSWVTVVVVNKYGETRETIEFEPSFSDFAYSDLSLLSADEVEQIQLYNVYGILVFSGTAEEFVNQSFPMGIYIKKEILKNGLAKTTKISLR